MLPSSIKYSSIEAYPLSRIEFVLSHLGFNKLNRELEGFLITNSHSNCLVSKEDFEYFKKCVDVDLIPDEYKHGKLYYKNYESLNVFNHKMTPKFDLKKFQVLFNPDISPGLVSDTQLAKHSTTLMIVCEMDSRKDEQLIYAERLKRAGVCVEVNFYENAVHAEMSLETNIANKIQSNIIDFINRNL
jgi:acetyl esterase/lipase